LENDRLQVENMTKVFPGVRALDRVSLRVKPGSVHALIGENGAGKSTLMKCLFGIYQPEEGTISLDGEKVSIKNTNDALRQGISMIHQELIPVPYRNVIDNIWVGRFQTKGLFVDEAAMYQKTEKLIRDLEFDIEPKTLAKNLSVSQLQAIEIAKAVSYDARVIIMDEPTSSLTVTETEHLFRIIRRLKSEGRSVIYISHRLEEIFAIADEISVMRDGQYIGTWETSAITIDKLINLMVGRDMEERFPPREGDPRGEVLLDVSHLTSANPRSFRDVSFELRKGEILGLGGLVGAQRTELVESIFGLRKISGGTLTMNGKHISNRTPREAISNGFALLTEERRATGIIPMLSVKENTLTASYRLMIRNKIGVLNPKKLNAPVEEVCKSLDVRMASTSTLIRNLSGGNQQKVLLGRWLLRKASILILDEPTRGVDVGAKYEIYRIMRELTAKGHAIIMVSSEMPELLGMSDRIMVMCEGRLTAILDNMNTTQVDVMQRATEFSTKTCECGD
jgi:methyl-galactoside transport system ATP-binding protein